MSVSKEYREAIGAMHGKKHASIKTTEGKIVEGEYFNSVSSTDDDMGIGYIIIKEENGNLFRIYSNEFSELIKAW